MKLEENTFMPECVLCNARNCRLCINRCIVKYILSEYGYVLISYMVVL